MMRTGKTAWGHLSGSSDLVTTHEAIRAGFVSLALEKNRHAHRRGGPSAEGGCI